MLKVMRKHARYFYGLFIVVILTFLFWGVGTVDNQPPPPLAVIGKEKLAVEEFWRTYDRMSDIYRDVYKEKFDDKMVESLKKVVLDSLIEESVLYQAAIDAGLKVSDSELEEDITNDPTFMRDGAFNKDVYNRTLQLNRMTPPYFETKKRRELIVKKMTGLIEESVDITIPEFGEISGDPTVIEQLRKALLDAKKSAAVKSYVEGLKKKVQIKVNEELLG